MNEKNLHVLSNIIAAVESGGQIYSEKRDWTAYAGARTNSSAEVTCTLGPYQAYGDEAQELVQYIWDHHRDAFIQCDPKGIIHVKLSVSWTGTHWNPTAEQKAILIKLLATDAGHEASEHVFQNRLKKYIGRAEEAGITSVEGQMMWAEVQHLGGLSAVRRIAARLKAPYGCDEWLDALRPDQSSSRYSSNGVGCKKYWSRHIKCVEFIQKYAEEEEKKSMGITAKQIIDRANHYIGYREKNHASADLESFKADAGSGNYQKFQPLAGAGNGDQWCQYFVDGVAVEVTGSIAAAKKLLCQTISGNYMTGYTPEGAQFFKNAGRWHTTPEPGDVVYFYTSSMGRICHTGYVYSVDRAAKTFVTVEGNTNNDGFATNGGCVAHHTYSYAKVGIPNRVVGFGRPRYAEEIQPELTPEQKIVKIGQENSVEFTGHQIELDGIRGSETTANMVRSLQHAANLDWNAGLKEDGVKGPKTRAAFEGHYIRYKEVLMMVTAVEICAYCRGKDANGIEYPGTYGDGLAAALGGKYLSGAEILKLTD